MLLSHLDQLGTYYLKSVYFIMFNSKGSRKQGVANRQPPHRGTSRPVLTLTSRFQFLALEMLLPLPIQISEVRRCQTWGY